MGGSFEIKNGGVKILQGWGYAQAIHSFEAFQFFRAQDDVFSTPMLKISKVQRSGKEKYEKMQKCPYKEAIG